MLPGDALAADADRSSKQILPARTAAFFSVADFDLLREHWEKTWIGQLVATPQMEPFARELRRQLEEKFRLSQGYISRMAQEQSHSGRLLGASSILTSCFSTDAVCTRASNLAGIFLTFGLSARLPASPQV